MFHDWFPLTFGLGLFYGIFEILVGHNSVRIGPLRIENTAKSVSIDEPSAREGLTRI